VVGRRESQLGTFLFIVIVDFISQFKKEMHEIMYNLKWERYSPYGYCIGIRMIKVKFISVMLTIWDLVYYILPS
jgi:hypothetical protein